MPLRFFLSAPLFGAAAGLLILYHGPEVFDSRWAPATLALTHLLTLGFMSLVMCGALMQMLPVLAGAVMPRPMLLSGLIHVLLVIGTMMLVGGFLIWRPAFLYSATALLGAGYLLVVAAVWFALASSKSRSATVVAMRIAVIALGLTVVLGILLVRGLSGAGSGLPLAPLTNVHVAWGMLGWTGLLICGVAYQVVPMFQITPTYPEVLTRYLAPVLFGALLAWSGLYLLGARIGFGPGSLVMWLVLAGFAIFALVTIRLMHRRKRRAGDITRGFWLLGMASALVAMGVWLIGLFDTPSAVGNRIPFLLGALLLVGFAGSIINGMLYKIVPFLIWFHLQRRNMSRPREARYAIPNVRQVIPTGLSIGQFRLHLAAVALTLLAAIDPDRLSRPAGLLLMLSFLMLEYNLLRAAFLYRRCHRRLLQHA